MASIQARVMDGMPRPRHVPVALPAERIGSRHAPPAPLNFTLHRPNDEHLVQLADHYHTLAESGFASVSFDRYAAVTQALIRLTVENPKRPRTRGRRELHPVRTDPLYALKLLTQYWSTLSHADSPLRLVTQLDPSQVAWWQMMASMQAVLGLPARTLVDGIDDRPQLLQMILESMRAHALPDGGVDGATNLYAYAIRHDTFFRALLFAAIQCNDLVFAASLLPLIPKVCLPAVGDRVEWTPIPRMSQMNLYHLFMAKCCTEIMQQYQAHDQSTAVDTKTTATAAATTTSSPLSAATPSAPIATAAIASTPAAAGASTDLSIISRSALVNLYPGFVDLYLLSQNAQSVSPLPFDRRMSSRFSTPLLSGRPSAGAFSAKQDGQRGEKIGARTSMIDLLLHAFKVMVGAGFTPMMHSYNFVLFGLTHTHTRADEETANAHSLPAASSVKSMLSECLSTISTERLAVYNMTSYTILLLHTVRKRSQELPLMSWTVRSLKDTLKVWKKREWRPRADDEGDRTMLPKMVGELLVHAAVALQKSAETKKAAKGILAMHEAIAPLLPSADDIRLLSSSPSSSAALRGLEVGVRGSRAPRTTWHKVVFVALAERGANDAVEEFLDTFFETLADSDLIEAIEAAPVASRQQLFETIEEWMSRLSAPESTGFKPDANLLTGLTRTTDLRNLMLNANTAPAVDANGKTSPASSTASIAVTPSVAPTSMAVSDIFLKWQLAKSRLPAKTRYQLGLGPPPPGFEAKHHGMESDTATVREAARYVIYHARKLHLEQAQVDVPLSHPSMHVPPEFDLPASIVGAPNFITGWVVICAGWFAHLGEENAFARIKGTLSLARQAARGSNEWDASAKVTMVDVKQEKPSMLQTVGSAIARWARQQKDKLLTNPLESIHIFTPLPPTTSLLETRIAFHQLHPELLNSIIYAYSTLPHLHDPKSPHWLRVLPRLEPFLDLFDLSHQHPLMLKFFTLQCASEPHFLRLLSQLPIASLPDHCTALARQWDSSRSTNELIRGRRLLVYLLRMTQETDATMQVLSTDGLKACIQPFMTKIAGKGYEHTNAQLIVHGHRVSSLLTCSTRVCVVVSVWFMSSVGG
jgi:hypothetical protein